MPKRPLRANERAPIEWRAALGLYKRHGWTIKRIAEAYGVAYATAWEHLQALGAKPRKSPAWHSVTGLRLNSIWHTLRQRCRSRRHQSYADYGARGIDVAAEWDRFDAFYEWALRSDYRVGMGLERMDRDRDFGPDNCYWLSPRETRRHAARVGVPIASKCMVTAFGETKSLKAWGRDPRAKVSWIGLARRLRHGAQPEAAITASHRSRWDPPLPKARRIALREPSPRTKIDWPTVLGLHRDRGLNPSEIAAMLGVRPAAISAGLRRRAGYRALAARRTTPDRHRLIKLWRNLWARTTNPQHELYPSNGAIGVRVCNEWADFEPFFRWAMESGSKPGLWLERIQRRGPYSPSNCRWVTRSEAISRAMKRLGARVRH